MYVCMYVCIHVCNGQIAAAIPHYGRAASLDPKLVQAHSNLGMSFLNLVYIHVCGYACMYVCVCVYVWEIHTYIHIHIHTYTHIHTYIHTYMHTHVYYTGQT